MNRTKLFVNKSLNCFKSIFEQSDKFAPIINIAKKYEFLFPLEMLPYSWGKYASKEKQEFELILEDYSYLHENFFYGVYVQDEKDKTRYHQVKRGIWEKLYDYFLTIANIINYNEKRKDINFGGYLVTLDNAWSNCCLRIFLILRSVLNNFNIKKDDISIWKLQTLLKKSTSKFFYSLYSCVEFLLDVFKFDDVFKKYVSKTIAHITNWDIKSLNNDKDLVSLNSAFNLFEGLYIVTKIIYYINSNNQPIYGMACDAENFNGDLLQQEMIAKGSELYYSEKLQNIADKWALAKTKEFCIKNKIEFNLDKLTIIQNEKIKNFVFTELKSLDNRSEIKDYIAYSKIIFMLNEKEK